MGACIVFYNINTIVNLSSDLLKGRSEPEGRPLSLFFLFLTWIYHYPVFFVIGVLLVLSVYNLVGRGLGIWRLFLHEEAWPRFLAAFGVALVAGQLMAATFFVEQKFHLLEDGEVVDGDRTYLTVAEYLRSVFSAIGIPDDQWFLRLNHNDEDHSSIVGSLSWAEYLPHIGRSNAKDDATRKIPIPNEKYKLRLVGPLDSMRDMPARGTNLVVVAKVSEILHVRVFREDGRMVFDTDETKLVEKAPDSDETGLAAFTAKAAAYFLRRQIGILKTQIENLWRDPRGIGTRTVRSRKLLRSRRSRFSSESCQSSRGAGRLTRKTSPGDG